MENKKLGMLLISIGIIIGIVLYMYNSALIEQSTAEGCFGSNECLVIEKNLSLSHIAIGIFAFILSLGFYLLFFNKTDEKILKRLENEKDKNVNDEKFDYALKFMDPFEKTVIKIINEQPGITQNTLRLRSDMSKAKLSYVLTDLEKRGIIKRIQKGKTLAIFLKL